MYKEGVYRREYREMGERERERKVVFVYVALQVPDVYTVLSPPPLPPLSTPLPDYLHPHYHLKGIPYNATQLLTHIHTHTHVLPHFLLTHTHTFFFHQPQTQIYTTPSINIH